MLPSRSELRTLVRMLEIAGASPQIKPVAAVNAAANTITGQLIPISPRRGRESGRKA
jgi:hypothetical protein